MTALLLGSISTLADTSELQRDAFNRAFAEHGLDWRWDRDDYRATLDRAGGRDRIAAYAQERGEQVDADAVHATKSAMFQESLAAADLSPRPGVVDTIAAAKRAGHHVGLVTTTARASLEALFTALAPSLAEGDFDVVVDVSQVDAPKPDTAAYTHALTTLGEHPRACIAVEDNPDGVRAAAGAGVACVAFPNENTEGLEFPPEARRVDHLDPADLLGAATGA